MTIDRLQSPLIGRTNLSPSIPDDESSGLLGFTLAFEDEYKRLIEESRPGEPSKSTDETSRAKRQSQLLADDSDAPNKRLRGNSSG